MNTVIYIWAWLAGLLLSFIFALPGLIAYLIVSLLLFAIVVPNKKT